VQCAQPDGGARHAGLRPGPLIREPGQETPPAADPCTNAIRERRSTRMFGRSGLQGYGDRSRTHDRDEDSPLDNWIWGLLLIALTIAIHTTGVTLMVSVLHSIRIRLENRSLRLAHVFAIVIATITAIGLLLAALHGIEAALWAAAYLWLGALGSPETAILYSVDSMATRGASGIMLQPHWQMMGALEAADGMVLFGISTAFIFTVMQLYYQHIVFRPQPDDSTKAE
jgi:hypothetical protein